MKKLIVFPILLLALIFTAQDFDLNHCGKDSLASLNNDEANYFNTVYHDRKGNFDFSGAKAAFVTGSSGTYITHKHAYFHRLGDDMEKHEWQAGGTQLLILSEEEKKLSGGYDVVFVYWSKLPCQAKRRERLIKSLGKK